MSAALIPEVRIGVWGSADVGVGATKGVVGTTWDSITNPWGTVFGNIDKSDEGLKKEFKKIDVDGSKYLSREEMITYIRNVRDPFGTADQLDTGIRGRRGEGRAVVGRWREEG